MTRDIKFRGCSLDNGAWIYGSLVVLNDRTFIFNDDMRGEVDTATVGQYTGLKDKNGVEIYEGDIIRVFNTIGLVEWRSELSAYEIATLDRELGRLVLREASCERYEVIGNVHDNPELLKNK